MVFVCFVLLFVSLGSFNCLFVLFVIIVSVFVRVVFCCRSMCVLCCLFCLFGSVA